jgi:dynactin complex subunit
VGVEWDELSRGKHNGTVNGHTYFICPDRQGSLLKYDKIEFGYKLLTGYFKRYFKTE